MSKISTIALNLALISEPLGWSHPQYDHGNYFKEHVTKNNNNNNAERFVNIRGYVETQLCAN